MAVSDLQERLELGGFIVSRTVQPKAVARTSKKSAECILTSVETLGACCLWPPEETCTLRVQGRESIWIRGFNSVENLIYLYLTSVPAPQGMRKWL